jgi:hypothetical protein
VTADALLAIANSTRQIDATSAKLHFNADATMLSSGNHKLADWRPARVAKADRGRQWICCPVDAAHIRTF